MTGIQLDNDTKDLLIRNGHLQIGPTSEQNQYLILTTHAGEWKENPTLGVGVEDYLNETDFSGLKYSIRENFKKDGLNVQKIEIINNQLSIDADYGSKT